MCSIKQLTILWIFTSVTYGFSNGLTITRHPENTTILEDKALTLRCKADGNEPIRTHWYHNGKLLPDTGQEYIIRPNGALKIRETKLRNGGSYQCVKEDDTGKVFSYISKVKVETPVKFVKRLPITRHVPFGGPVELQCIVAGIPKPIIQWKRNGKLIDNPPPLGIKITNRNISVSDNRVTSVLRIKNVTVDTSFTCEAKNAPKGFTSMITRNADVIALKTIGTGIKPGTPAPGIKQGGICAPYNGSQCKSNLGTQFVYMSNVAESDGRVQQLLDEIRTSQPTMDNRCMESAKKILCQNEFPKCDSKGEPIQLCRESCLAVKELLCFDQWLLVMNMGDRDHRLPDCQTLPSKYEQNKACVDSNIFVKKEEEVTNTCYVGTGQWYNGTVNVTKSGLQCQFWSSHEPHTHRRPPNVFPTLQNAENYCRNPGSEEASPWCYTQDKLIRWEPCDIPKCEMPPVSFEGPPEEEQRFSLVAILIVSIVTSVGAFVLGLIAVLCYQIISQRKQVKYNTTPQDDLEIDIDKLTTNMSYHKVSDSCKLSSKLEALEYPRNDIVYIRDIGQGAFGRVFKAKAPNLSKDGEESIIAVKMLKDDASDDLLQDFSREASLMADFNHPNIVKMLGVCAIGKPMCLLFEYMNRGDLNELLRRASPEHYIVMRPSVEIFEDIPSLDNVELLYVCMQISSGMVYLSERGYVHRDLATRNCLVADNLNVKIADFGLARSVHTIDYYKGSEHDAIPIRWMPLESILYNKFTAESDVWSFGILMWEVFSFALQPYYGMTHEEVIKFIKDGKVLACPDNTPKQVYDLMRLCWSRKPMHRPPFQTLHNSLKTMHDDFQKRKLRENANNIA